MTRSERNALIVEVTSSVRRAWPELRGQVERGHAWPDAALTDAIARAVDEHHARLEADLAALREAAQAVVDSALAALREAAQAVVDSADGYERYERSSPWLVGRPNYDVARKPLDALRAVLASADSEDPAADLPADLLRVLRDPNIVIDKDREIMLDGKPLLDHIREWRNAPSNTASGDSEEER